MDQVDNKRVTVRELVDSAVNQLELRDSAKKWATKRALIQIARNVRDARCKEIDEIGRDELKTSLEKIESTAINLKSLLNRQGIEKAIESAWAARDQDIDSPETFEALDRAPGTFRELPILLDIVAASAKAAPEKLLLSGKGGHGPWGRFELPPKQLLALSVARLYQFSVGNKKLPGANNKRYVTILGLLWEAATGLIEEGDWSTTIKSARLQRGTPESRERRSLAYISTRMQMMEIFKDWQQWVEGRQKPK